jgi:hypothetical protein
MLLGLAVTVRPPFEPGQITADAVVQAFDCEGVGFALDMVDLAEDFGIGVPGVGGKDELGGVRKLASNRSTVAVPRSPSVPPRMRLAARSIAHQSQRSSFCRHLRP